MDIFRCISARLARCFLQTQLAFPLDRLDDLESSPFRQLPPELIYLIASFLPLESVGILSLSCLHLYSCLKIPYLQSLRVAEYAVVNRFLHLLERDLPSHIVCPECNKLHNILFAERHKASQLYVAPQKDSLKCRIMDSTGHYIGGLPGGFSSTIFRMATKAYRQGRDTTTLLNLLSYRKMDGRLWGFVELHKVEPRISQGGSLLIREQKVYLIPSLQKTPLPWYGGFGICRHIPFMEMTDLYRWGIQVPGADELINGFENTQGIIYCQYCYSEFRVDFKGYGKAGNVLFITRWIDLGDGKEADDFKRRIRLYGSERRRRVTYQRGSIYTAFEQQNAEFKFESTLTKQDEKELTTRCWPWPDYANVSAKEVEIGYVVRSGRLVPKFQTRKRR